MQTFTGTREAGLARLADFLPRAGAAYARDRNVDLGPDDRTNVSMLSPWLRRRMLAESEVLMAVVARHGDRAAETFIQEVFWRTYWKGWLEMRADVWTRWRSDIAQMENDTPDLVAARAGRTGIDCFDAWARELTATGWLHNHARMWFASIWIFTLRLPWQLGASFFADHLADFDPASNTLSWRWVAGLHTRGKHYLARADNIAKNTRGRFFPKGQLDETAPPLPLDDEPVRRPLRDLPTFPPLDLGRRTGLLVTSEDRSGGTCMVARRPTAAIAVLAETHRDPASPAGRFAAQATADAATRHGAPVIEDIAAWAAAERLDDIITAEAPLGTVRDRLAEAGVPVREVRDLYDADAWPNATHGFFRFREAIPELLARHADLRRLASPADPR
jgi:deoxyribodipyrimidine photo-lyase